MASSALLVVYTLAALLLVLFVGYAYMAWAQYRRAMDAAVRRRRERDHERGERMTSDNYWIRDPPPQNAPPLGHHSLSLPLPQGYTPTAVCTATATPMQPRTSSKSSDAAAVVYVRIDSQR
uniref:Uncharacterized protein n=1 Tax=Globisporangium ultimum (strain ATCC 200006 / CBS 805.95 / DAOM BR144) TaxID=431595 RepID=K3WLF8_GLOUD